MFQNGNPKWTDGTPPMYEHPFIPWAHDASHQWKRTCHKSSGRIKIDETNMTETYGNYMFTHNTSSSNCTGLLLQPDGSSLGWIRIPCRVRFNASFACAQSRNISLGIHSDQKLSNLKKCEIGWILVRGNCYYIKSESEKILSARDAMGMCTSLNASLPDTYYFYDKRRMSSRQKKIRDNFAMHLRRAATLELINSFADRSIQDFPSVDIFSESTDFGPHYKPYGTFPIQRELDSTVLQLLDIIYYYKPIRDDRQINVWTTGSTTPCLYTHVSEYALKIIDMLDDELKPMLYPWLGEDLECRERVSVNYIVCTVAAEQIESKCPSDYYFCADGSCILRGYVQDGHNDCNNGEDEGDVNTPPSNHTGVKPVGYYTCISLVNDDASSLIPFHAVCDGITQCLNNDDEQGCQVKEQHKYTMHDLVGMNALSCSNDMQFLSFCYFDRKISLSDSCYSEDYLSHCEIVSCSSMFKCHKSYCISIDKVCDGIADCLSGDDEEGCSGFVCIGMLRCRGDVHCVAPWQICDRIPHCETFDDEVNCQDCPDNCHCSDHVIFCHVYSNEWYLDVWDAFKIVKFKGEISDLVFLFNYDNIKILDLSYCHLINIYQNSSRRYTHIPYVYLNNNKLNSVPDRNFNILGNVFYLNISYNHIITIHNFYFERLSVLDLSYNMVTHIYIVDGLPVVRYINLQGNKLVHIEHSFLQRLSSVKVLIVDKHLVCCVIKMTDGCQSLSNINMCPRILAKYIKFAILSFSMLNIIVILVYFFRKQIDKKHTKRRPDRGITLIQINMAVSCILINIYIIILVVSDFYYSHSYAQLYNLWISSITCKLAATICLVSNGTCILQSSTKSVYILLKTMFPFKQLTNKLRLTCLIVWCFMIGIAVPPIVNQSETSDNLNHVGFELCIVTSRLGAYINVSIVFGALVGYICQIICYFIVYKLSSRSAITAGYNISICRRLKFVNSVLLLTCPDLLLIIACVLNILLSPERLYNFVYVVTTFPLLKLVLLR